MHEMFLKVHLPAAPDGVLTYGKSKSALKYSNGKGMWFQSLLLPLSGSFNSEKF